MSVYENPPPDHGGTVGFSVRQVVGSLGDSDWRRLGGCMFGAIVFALMTGASGNAQHLTDGVTGSLFRPRIVVFLVLGLALWALMTVWTRYRDDIRTGLEPFRTTKAEITGNRWVQLGTFAAVLLMAVLIPPMLSVFWQQVLVSQIGIFVLLAIGLNVVVGFAGLLDLGYIAFYAIGAYTAAYWTGYPDDKHGHISPLPVHPPFHLNPFFVFPIAVLVCLIAGLLLGAPTLRLRGDYLAIVTLGFGEIVRIVINNSESVTNGPRGAFGIPHFSVNLGFYKYKWTLDLMPYWYLLLAMIVIVFILFRQLENSRVGRAWTAIREDEVAAAATGIPTLKYKLMAFAIGASTSGLAGVVFASQIGFVAPDNFVLINSLLVLVYVIFGGMGSLPGAVAGASFLIWLPNELRDHVAPQDRFIYFGALLVVMMIFRPQGVFPSRRRAREIGLAESGAGGADAMGAPGGVLAQ
ncbi:MAG: branched-chain amino acid ABC transporter permease [Frankiaceae bacterium]|nr:branched-chain amino acid ABC transporter permease [Frankiaceae bacterium]MBV9368290.1 branched-chain amino acid ABC transporter permease [Frankiales bacterium]